MCAGCRFLILAGCLTDQCVESAVRDACDKHYYVTLVTGDSALPSAAGTAVKKNHCWFSSSLFIAGDLSSCGNIFESISSKTII